jgi:hypothetical protein
MTVKSTTQMTKVELIQALLDKNRVIGELNQKIDELEGMAVASMSIPIEGDQNSAVAILVARIKRLEEIVEESESPESIIQAVKSNRELMRDLRYYDDFTVKDDWAAFGQADDGNTAYILIRPSENGYESTTAMWYDGANVFKVDDDYIQEFRTIEDAFEEQIG